MMGAASNIKVGHVAAVHALLDGKVEHRLFLPVIDAGDTGLIALLVVELHILNDAHGQVFQRRFRIAEHEFLAVEQNLLHLLAVDGDVTIFIHLCTWHPFDEFLDGRSLGCTVGFGVVHQSILPSHHLRGPSSYHCFFQYHRLGRHQQQAHVLILITA